MKTKRITDEQIRTACVAVVAAYLVAGGLVLAGVSVPGSAIYNDQHATELEVPPQAPLVPNPEPSESAPV